MNTKVKLLELVIDSARVSVDLSAIGHNQINITKDFPVPDIAKEIFFTKYEDVKTSQINVYK